jgi:DNA-binding NtrC family response regulator
MYYNQQVKQPNILLVDDDKNFLHVLSHHVRDAGFCVIPTFSGREALEKLKHQAVDLVITDLRMPEIDGLRLLEEIHGKNRLIPVIVLTAHGSIDKAVAAIKAGAFDFLTKPFEREEVLLTVRNALKMADLMKENRALSAALQERFKFGGIIGSSKAFRQVLEQAEQLAVVETTVLLQGESGTGKEILARAIHFNSQRRNRPFVVVNCGAIPENLVESELFGYRKGSFTGALSDRKGKFEAADSGTLFLDEVGDLPLATQVKLLRVLQEKEIDIIGQPESHPVDVRIVAASNRDLLGLMREGTFREDLYYRLAVAPLLIPPLRGRREDIPLLLHHFLDFFNRKFNKSVAFDPASISHLQKYNWPGNVRELENLVERLLVFNRSGAITLDDLPEQYRVPAQSLGKVVLQLPEDGLSMEELERDLLRVALRRHNWNQTRTANYLRITRNTLIYRMHKYNIRPVETEASA